MIIRIEDARALGYCSKGMRLFCKKYNINYLAFAQNGIEDSVLLETNDAMAIKVVEKAEEIHGWRR